MVFIIKVEIKGQPIDSSLILDYANLTAGYYLPIHNGLWDCKVKGTCIKLKVVYWDVIRAIPLVR
jgi:hypothetical protein